MKTIINSFHNLKGYIGSPRLRTNTEPLYPAGVGIVRPEERPEDGMQYVKRRVEENGGLFPISEILFRSPHPLDKMPEVEPLYPAGITPTETI